MALDPPVEDQTKASSAMGDDSGFFLLKIAEKRARDARDAISSSELLAQGEQQPKDLKNAAAAPASAKTKDFHPSPTSKRSTKDGIDISTTNNNDYTVPGAHAVAPSPSTTAGASADASTAASNTSFYLPRRQQQPPAAFHASLVSYAEEPSTKFDLEEQAHTQQQQQPQHCTQPPNDVTTSAHHHDDVIEGIREEGTKQQRNEKILMVLASICILLLLVIIVLLVLGFTGTLSAGSDDIMMISLQTPPPIGQDVTAGTTTGPATSINTSVLEDEQHKDVLYPNMTTMQRIRREGILRCADVYLPNGFVYYHKRSGEKTGFYGELCHAIAAALGVRAIFVPQTHRWGFFSQLLDPYLNQTADVTIIGLTRNMERSVHVQSSNSGFRFTSPMLHGGLRMGGDPYFIENCIDKDLNHIDGRCRDLKICISNTTTHWTTAKTLLPQRFFVIKTADGVHQFEGLKAGDCNVVAAGMFQLSLPNAYEQGISPSNYSLSGRFFSKEPMSMVTAPHDPDFSNFVESVLQALYVAEYFNITQATADNFPSAASVLGDDLQDAWRNAIRHAGNYGELYQRFLEDYIPRSSLNLINTGDTGLLYSHPWGKLHLERDTTTRPLGRILRSILDRGRLRCGIEIDRPGMADAVSPSGAASEHPDYRGMEVDLCRAITAGLFGGDDTALEFVEVQQQQQPEGGESSTNAFQKLVDREIDVAAGVLWSIVNIVNETTTGVGFVFSQPYFYGQHDNLALATLPDDEDWSNFVYWTVSALLYAEENSIHVNNSLAMPEVLFYGNDRRRMFRDAVLAVGNFGDIYQRNVEPLFPRSGRNKLNAYPMGPQNYPLPGYMPLDYY